MSRIRVLLDGWGLAYEPNGPAALHLHSLFDHWPDQIEATAALPSKAQDVLPISIESKVVKTTPTPAGYLGWEQRFLPRLAKEMGGQTILLTCGTAPLFGSKADIVCPAGYELPNGLGDPNAISVSRPERLSSLAERLHDAMAEGGLIRVQLILWPEDLPNPKTATSILRLPAIVPDLFGDENSSLLPGSSPSDMDIPDDFVLYHGSGSEPELRLLLESWGWVNRAIGETTSLLAVGLEKASRQRFKELSSKTELESSLRVLPEISLSQLSYIYRQCRALFHPGSISPWGDPLHLALACGKPIAAVESAWADARLGPAAYLTPADGRALGAALVTILVEEDLADNLSNEAKKRSIGMRAATESFNDQLRDVFVKLVNQ